MSRYSSVYKKYRFWYSSINFSWRTALHKDAGDLDEGLVILLYRKYEDVQVFPGGLKLVGITSGCSGGIVIQKLNLF